MIAPSVGHIIISKARGDRFSLLWCYLNRILIKKAVEIHEAFKKMAIKYKIKLKKRKLSSISIFLVYLHCLTPNFFQFSTNFVVCRGQWLLKLEKIAQIPSNTLTQQNPFKYRKCIGKHLTDSLDLLLCGILLSISFLSPLYEHIPIFHCETVCNTCSFLEIFFFFQFQLFFFTVSMAISLHFTSVCEHSTDNCCSCRFHFSFF